ncbi:hypothetical protein N7540_005829 [Penicillium herquei]|nr:hypothetical protein N7540_005829 [Penicillium herquei]
MGLCDLPQELVQLIVEFLDSESSINALARTKRAFFVEFNPFLYRYHVSRPPHHTRTWVYIPALTWAAEHDDLDLLDKLVDVGADLFEKRIWRWDRPLPRHPIWAAAKGGHIGFLEALLDSHGMGSRLRESDYAELVAKATLANQIGIVRMLLSRDIDPWCAGSRTSMLLSGAIRWGSPELFELLLLDFKQRDTLPPIAQWKDAYSALKYAQWKDAYMALRDVQNSEHITQLLVTAGIDVNHALPGSGGVAIWRPLYYCGHPGPARLLLEAGANPNIDHNDRWGPLASVVDNFQPTLFFKISSQEQRECRMEMIQLLFEYGAEPHLAGGGWALHGALRDLDFSSATFLADKGARIIVSELTETDQALLDQAVVEHEWGKVMTLTPLNWSLINYAGPGLVRNGNSISAYRLPAECAGGDLAPWMISENRLIDESDKLPLPSPVPGNNLDESERT